MHVRKLFQSTLPMRGATGYPLILDMYITISIHTPHAGSDLQKKDKNNRYRISIHTPHAGSDGDGEGSASPIYISIHTPHAGSDISGGALSQTEVGFQSTLPMRGATTNTLKFPATNAISIHTPHAGSDTEDKDTIARAMLISIHTPHAGSDLQCSIVVN